MIVCCETCLTSVRISENRRPAVGNTQENSAMPCGCEVDANRIVAFAGIRLVDRSPAWEQAGLFNQQSLSQATVPALWHPCDII